MENKVLTGTESIKLIRITASQYFTEILYSSKHFFDWVLHTLLHKVDYTTHVMIDKATDIKRTMSNDIVTSALLINTGPSSV